MKTLCLAILAVQYFGPEGNISTNVGWIAIRFSTDIYGPQRMKPNEFGGDRLTFHVVTQVKIVQISP